MKTLTVAELIAELEKRYPKEKVFFEWEEYPHCNCPEYCYCTTETVQAKIQTVDSFNGVVVLRGEKL